MVTHTKNAKRIRHRKYVSVRTALNLFFASINFNAINSLRPEHVHLFEANRRVLAEDLRTGIDVPPFDRADRDGYALRSFDTKTALHSSPVSLDIVGRSSAGDGTLFPAIKPRQAMAIATGARIPKGVDSVIMIEDTITDKTNRLVKILKPMRPGENITRRGTDIKKEMIVLRKGTWLTSQDVAMIASIGLNRIAVVEKPKVGLISTGDELTEPGYPTKNDSCVFESNRYMLSCLISDNGGQSVDLGLCDDNAEAIFDKLKSALRLEMVVISGGASVGEKDFAPLLVRKLGKPGLVVRGIAMKPGSPTGLGIVDNKPIIVAPGFPVSSFVAFYTFGSPLLLKLLGTEGPPKPTIMAKMTETIEAFKDFQTFVRVCVYRHNGRFLAKPVSASGASLLSTLTNSNGIVIVNNDHEQNAELKKGQVVEVTLLKNVIENP
jgi:molybdenum cofactor synthesis domain-containing protein